ncbi:MFS transporter [Paenalcaligenes hominis]|uniref:MFS transporter n=1 Tax=Paenalcaligenes hominis TaxID=643674 RepID=UPI003525B04F
MTSTTLALHQEKKRDWAIISLLGLIHSSSHFFQLILPTLFVYLHQDYGYDYVQLGFLVSCFYLVSGLGQASSGFIVDRIGPAPVMYFGLGAFVVSASLMALAPSYAFLVLAAIIGGAGNSIFHPVDYTIINHRITAPRLGHAYSVHGFTGYLGWAATPLFITVLGSAYGWRFAVMMAAVLIAVLLVISIWQRELWGEAPQNDENKSVATQSIGQTLVFLLRQPALWCAFLFFAFSSAALSAIQNYSIPLLSKVYGLSQVVAGSTLSAYMVAAAIGMIAGGFLVGASKKTERIIFIMLCLAGACMLLLALDIVSSSIAIVLVTLGGVCSGVAAPSRDMLIRSVTPKGATGSVYGLVYSGMDVGAAIAPVVFGHLIDAQFERAPWYGGAIAFVLSAVLAMAVAKGATQQKR